MRNPIVLLMTVTLMVSGAWAQEPAKTKPLPAPPADVFTPAPAAAKIAAAHARRQAAREGFLKARGRLMDLVARWNARPSLAGGLPGNRCCLPGGVRRGADRPRRTSCGRGQARRAASSQAGVGAAIRPQPEDPWLAFIQAQDGIHPAEQPVVQQKTAKAKVAAK